MMIVSFSAQLSFAVKMVDFKKLEAPAQFLAKEVFDHDSNCSLYYYVDEMLGEFHFQGPAGDPKKWTIEFFPSSYQRPLTWYRRCGEQVEKLRSVTYQSPAPYLNRKVVRSWGQCGLPFIMGEAMVEDEPLNGAKFAVAWNLQGEAVWAYSKAFESGGRTANAVLPHEVGLDEWVFLSRQYHSVFTHMKKNGQVLKSFSFREHNLPANAQGYYFDANKRELSYLGFECKTDPHEKDGPSYRSRFLINLNVDTLQWKKLWSSFTQFKPTQTPNAFLGQTIDMDPYLDFKGSERKRQQKLEGRAWYDWPDKLCQTDWSHENSVDYHPERGYLISSRNLNKLTLLSPDRKHTQVIGTKPTCDLCLDPKLSFSSQHSAQFINRDHILLFDNHLMSRGDLGARDASRLVVLELKGLPARSVRILRWMTVPGLQSLQRGYAGTMSNNNLFVYNPGNAGTVESYLEYSPLANKYLCRTDFENLGSARPIETRAFTSLGGEQWQAPPRPVGEDTSSPSWLDEVISDVVY